MGLMAIAAGIIFLREPGFFLDPRLWAEEGSLYFVYAYYASWWEGLITPHLGYYALFPNAIGVIAAKTLPLEHVAFFHTTMSSLVMMIPIGIISFSSDDLFDRVWKKTAGIGLVLFTMASGEIWLNTINAHFYLLIACFLVLIEDDQNTPSKLSFNRFVLVFSSSTGPLTPFLAPLFFVKWAWARSQERLVQACILSGGVLVQVAALLYTLQAAEETPSRLSGFDPPLVSTVLLHRSVMVPLLGPNVADRVFHTQMMPAVESIPYLLCSALSLGVILWFSSRYLDPREKTLYVGGLLTIAVVTIALGHGQTVSFLSGSADFQRYFFVPAFLLLMTIFANAQAAMRQGKPMSATLLLLVVGGAIANGSWHYRSTFWRDPSWPSWREEVRAWKEDSDDKIEIWPSGWTVDIRAN